MRSSDQPSSTLHVECPTCGHDYPFDPNEIDSHHYCAFCDTGEAKQSSRWSTKVLTFTLASLVFFVTSNTLPFITVELGSSVIETSFLSGVYAMLSREEYFLGFLLLGTICVLPFLELLSLLYVSLAYELQIKFVGLRSCLHLLDRLRPWSMMEIFLLSILVAAYKMREYLVIEPGWALISFFALVFCMLTAIQALDSRAVWEWLSPQKNIQQDEGSTYMVCKNCYAINTSKQLEETEECLRCERPMEILDNLSFQKTLALTLASIILYIPANSSPILISTSLGDDYSSTILAGVVHLLEAGAWPVALVIFVASVLIPFVKILTLCVLLFSVHLDSTSFIKQKIQGYKFIEVIGRWSMIDVFVVILLVALVQFGVLVTVEPGSAAIAFGAVVVLTMLAAEEFDSRLLTKRKRK